MTYRELFKILPNNSTIFAAEATAIILALNYYQHMDPVQHDVMIYSDSMSEISWILLSDMKVHPTQLFIQISHQMTTF